MDKKYFVIGTIFSICGIIGGIMLVVAAFMGDAFPLPLRLVASICMFLNAIGIIMNMRYIRKQQADKETK